MEGFILGVDTSCYTTSVAAVSLEGALLANEKRLLLVPEGGRGLRQSEGLFQHVQALPELIESACAKADGELRAVAVSVAPRDVAGSYMPVFTAGVCAARAMAAAKRIPLYSTSHQRGHIRAALEGSGLTAPEFLAMHISGGTTEIVRVDAERLELLGGTEDLHAGQLVDRVGVALGLRFPAGPELERLAERGTAAERLPAAVRGTSASLSGAEAQALRWIAAGERAEDIAAELFAFLARSFARMLAAAQESTGLHSALIAGGVASSQLLRALLEKRLQKLGCRLRLHYAQPGLSADNAAGVAWIGRDRYTEKGVE